MRFGWRDEALEWIKIHPEEISVVKKGNQVIKATVRMVIVSYEMISRNESLRRRADGQPYGVVVLDECHFIKNRDSQRSKVAIELTHEAKRAILLSGTPSLNQAAELFTQFAALLPEVCPKFYPFADRFCEKVQVKFGRGKAHNEYRGSKRLAELNCMLVNTIMIRRLKSEVLTQLPKKRRQKVKLDVKPSDLKELKALMASNGIGEETTEFEQDNVCELFRATSRAKLSAVQDYVEYLVDVGCKFLIFAHHHFCIDAIEEKVKSLKVDYIRIDGRVAGDTREKYVRKFNEGGLSVPIAILSITACGQGLNLQSCSTVVFAELYWVPGALIQAEDRVHRLGQEADSVNIHYLVVPESVDDIMYGILTRKHKELSAMLDGKERCLGAANVTKMGSANLDKAATSREDIKKAHEKGFVCKQEVGRRKRKLEPDPNQPTIDSFFKRIEKNKSADGFGPSGFF